MLALQQQRLELAITLGAVRALLALLLFRNCAVLSCQSMVVHERVLLSKDQTFP